MKRHRLRIVSYNVHSWVGGRDRRRDVRRTAEVLRELDADVVALQEARDLGGDRLAGPLAELCEEHGYALVEGPTLEHDKWDYGNALLCRLPVRGVSRLDLSMPGREPRGALSVSLECAQRRVSVVNTHLGLRARERGHQVAKLLEWIGAEVAVSAPDVLSLVGDFNEWRPRSPTLRRVDAAFEWMTAPRSFPALQPWLRLDRIWVLPRSAVARKAGGFAHRSSKAGRASDHLPVVVDLELPARKKRRPDSDAA